MKCLGALLRLMVGAVLAPMLFTACAWAGPDAEARLEQLQTQMEEAVQQGQGVPPALMEEMQKLLDEMTRDDPEDEPDQKSNWASVPFRGRVTIHVTGKGRYSVPEGGTFSASIARSATATIRDCREVRNEEGELEDHIPQGIVQTSVQGRYTLISVSKECTLTASHTLSGSDHRSFGEDDVKALSVMLDPERRVYTISLPSGWADAVIRERIHGCRADEEKDFTGSVRVSALPHMEGKEEKTEYPYHGGSLTNGYTVQAWASVLGWEVIRGDSFMPEGHPLLDTLRREGGGESLFPVNVHVSWSLSLQGDDVEAVIEPVGDYDAWRPTADGSGVFKARVRIVKPEGAKGHMVFRLTDVGTVPGECMNSPPADPDTRPDLRLTKMGSGKGIWVNAEGTEAKTEDPVNEAVIAVQSLDYGAWGRLEADVKVVVKGEEQETRAVFKPLGTDWLSLPRDDDGDHVADGWVQQMGVDDGALDDNDPTPNRIYPGDGLSLYEEYRGFLVQGRHVRTDPKVQDLFIWDPDGLIPQSRVATGALGPMHVHQVAAEEIKAAPGAQHRMINFNYDPALHTVDQHGLLVFIGEAVSGGKPNIGHTYLSVTNPTGRLGPPVESARIEVNPTHIFQQIRSVIHNHRTLYDSCKGPDWPDEAWYEARLAETIAFAVAHEVAHGVGVRHHEPESGPPHHCLMSQPEASGVVGFCAFNLFKGDYAWGDRLCDKCMRQIMVSDIYEGQGYSPP